MKLALIQQGEGDVEDINALSEIARQLQKASLCKKGKDSGLYLKEWLQSGIFQEHINRCCSTLQCPSMIEYKIISRACTNCGKCKDACRFGAIVGETKTPFKTGYIPFEILEKKCNRCGECIKVCPESAIVLECVA